MGIIKEVAPTTKVENDSALGVGAFERDYFPYALYLDEAKAFYQYLGNRKFFTLRSAASALSNPLGLYRSIKAIGQRMQAKNIEGNLAGEGNLQGGVLVVAPDGTVVYSYQERTGSIIPADDVAAALRALK